jgi:hypothetical protein
MSINLLLLFVTLKIAKYLLEAWLSALNKSYYENPQKQELACQTLQIETQDLKKASCLFK